MSLMEIECGKDIPNQINVIIEIPMFGQPVKYEVDKTSGALFVDRFMSTAMYYPANYGYIPKTLSEDGDPVDVLVVAPVPLLSGSVIPCRPIGMLNMEDEAGPDVKVIAVPIDKLTKMYQNVQSYQELSEHLLMSLEHFFSHYKDLEEGKWVKITGWADPEYAKNEITASVERFNQSA